MKTMMKKVTISVVACMVLSGSVFGFDNKELPTLKDASNNTWQYGKLVIAKQASQYAEIAKDAYQTYQNTKEYIGKKVGTSDWALVTTRHEDMATGSSGRSEDSKSGFDVNVYKNPEGKYVIAFRGTDGKQDIFADGDIAEGKNVKQYQRALEFVENYRELYLKNVPKDDIVLTGHSLGGGLAQAVGATLNIETYAFDAAPVPKEYIKQHQNEIDVNKKSSNQRAIIRISDKNDPLTMLTSILENGGLNSIESSTANKDNMEHLSNRFVVYDFESGTDGHSMDDLYKGLHQIAKYADKEGIDTNDAMMQKYLDRYFQAPSTEFYKDGIKKIDDYLSTYESQMDFKTKSAFLALKTVIHGNEDPESLKNKYNMYKFNLASEATKRLLEVVLTHTGTDSIFDILSSDAYLKDALSTKVVDSTKTIETTRKLELDRQLAKHDVDIFFLADNTGSMGGLVGSAQTNAQAILDALRADSRFSKVNAQFGVGSYLGDPSEGEAPTSAYKLLQAITNSDTAVTTAINQWYADGGGDWEEGNFYAIQQVIDSGAGTPRDASLASTQATGWRDGAQKVIVVFGDAPSWQNSVNEKELKALAIAAGAKIVFIDTSAINVGQTSNVYTSMSGQQMQDAAVEIADATGGSYMALSDVSNIKDAVLDSVYDAIADNKWTGGMVSQIGNTVWRSRTPSSVTALSEDDVILTFTLSYPNQTDSTFNINTDLAAQVIDTGYYEGAIADATNIFGHDMSSGSVFHVNEDQDFFRYILQTSGNTVEGYYGERLSSASKLPTTGISVYDIRERVLSPYTQTSYASDGMKMFVNWTTGKVYAFDTNALMDSAEGTAIFVGDIDRTALEISGQYTFKSRRLSASEASNLPRVIKDAMRDTTTIQLYGNAYPNGIGGTFGATYYDESLNPSLSSMMMSGYVNTKNVTTWYSPSDNEVWSGHAVGFVANRSTGGIALDSSTTTDTVQVTIKPSAGEVKASITVTDGSTDRTLATDYTDTNVYVNQNAFVTVKDSSGVPNYVATTMNEKDNYNYLSWGTWSTELPASNKTIVDGSSWIAGKLTPTGSMPSSGTATYSGTIQGMAYESNTMKGLNGTNTMTANFGSGVITGTMDVNYASSGASYATTNLNTVSISGNSFAGGLSGSGNTGSIKGSFYGPSANEIGGTWKLDKTGSIAAGVFAGKK